MSSVKVLRRLIDLARSRKKPLIHLQHNPDPDALASGLGLKYLLERLLGHRTVLAYTGRVGRVENRAMLRELGIGIKPSYKIDYSEYDLVGVVDTHPGAGTCRLPEGVRPDIVVDHHPSVNDLRDVPLLYFDPNYGSTSTMVGALMVENGIPIPPHIATALTYGIRTDTLDLARSEHPQDEKIYREVFGLADKRALARIERARVPQTYFVVLERALRGAEICDHAITTYLGQIEHSDMVAEVADLLFRLEGIRWVMVAGTNGALLYCSIRALKARDVEAGAVAREISGGHGGGHDTFAAAQIPLDEEAAADPDAYFQQVRDHFLKLVGAKKSLRRPLTEEPETEALESES